MATLNEKINKRGFDYCAKNWQHKPEGCGCEGKSGTCATLRRSVRGKGNKAERRIADRLFAESY